MHAGRFGIHCKIQEQSPLYSPGKAGAYATIAGESEEVIGEVDVTVRSKIAISAFYVNDRRDFGTFKITNSQALIPGSAGANAEAFTLTVSN